MKETQWIEMPRENENLPDGRIFFSRNLCLNHIGACFISQAYKRQQNVSALTCREFSPNAL